MHHSPSRVARELMNVRRAGTAPVGAPGALLAGVARRLYPDLDRSRATLRREAYGPDQEQKEGNSGSWHPPPERSLPVLDTSLAEETQRSLGPVRHPGMTEDAALVSRALNGDRDAFEGLVRRYSRPAFAIAVGIVKERADAEDVVQDAFIRALERLEDCRDPAKFGAWFLRIVRNRAHSVRRYLGVRDAAPLDALPLASGEPGPETETARARLRRALADAVAGLTEVQQDVLVLHDLQGWKHREIGALLDLPEGTVRAHLHHARKALRDNEALKRAKEDG